ncbi:MAG: Hsp70 family protein [Acidimicrobiia bacterium]|nr:Hsp70 family protein [Acidimicrobiia bacterium]
MTYVLGVDFGTTFSAAATRSPNDGSTRVVTLGNRSGAVPSAVFVRTDGTLLHGEDAYLRGSGEPEQLVRHLKRRLGDGRPVSVGQTTYSPEQLVAAYLRWMVDKVSEREGGPPERIVATHPASWRSVRLQGFRQAIELAGLSGVSLATEPYAAAVHHATVTHLDEGDLVAAYDLGGGTFDAAVLRRTGNGFELAGEPEGAEHLGGIDFDDVVFNLVRTKLGDTWRAAEATGGAAFRTAVSGLRRECIAAKEALSVDPEVDVAVMLPGVSRPVRLTRAELEQHVGPSIVESVGIFQRALRNADVKPSWLKAVLLVGGSSRLPVVRKLMGEAVPGVPLLDSDPKHAVARGAALLAAGVANPQAGGAGAAATGAVAGAAAAAVAGAGGSGPPAPAPAVSPQAPTATGPGGGVANAVGTGGASGPVPPTAVAPTAPDADGSRRSRTPLLAAAALVVAIALGAAYVVTSRGGDDEVSTATDSTATPASEAAGIASSTGATEATAAPPVTVAVRFASAERMSAIPAGTYTVGAEAPGPETVAARVVELPAFHIDTFEVTNGDYNRFLQAQGAPAPLSWGRTGFAEGQDDFPVTGVDWEWAQAYCASLAKRLPTEGEWEAAARGPDGLAFPWGPEAAPVDLETPGVRAVGAVPENVSAFGVRDTVGSVWEWVGEPYDETEASQRVRRGGEYGRVRGGAAMRQAVVATNEAVVKETGFRCAADHVDASVPYGEFGDDFARPGEVTRPTTAGAGSVASGVLVDEHFEDPDSGWVDRTDELTRVGYHAPNWYHVEASKAEVRAIAVGGFNYADAMIETAAYVDKTDTQDKRFRYGLVFRADGPLRDPVSGQGTQRPANFYAFTVDPRAGEWEVVHEDSLPLRTVAKGKVPASFNGFDLTAADKLGVEMRGSKIVLWINGESVGEIDTRGYHLQGDLGFYVETFDESKAHIHFESLKVTAL